MENKQTKLAIAPNGDAIKASSGEVVPTKTVWGAFSKPTPPWANLAFRWFFWVTSIITLVVTTLDGDISVEAKLQITKYVILANLIAHSLAKQLGLEIDTDKLSK